MRRLVFGLALVLASSALANGDQFLVATAGVDDPLRDGKTADTAWKSLAFACDQVPAGRHTISIGAGEFVATRTAWPKAGIAIAGQGTVGEEATRIVAAADWKISPKPCNEELYDEYLIAIKHADGVTVSGLALCSTPEHRITGAIYCRGSKQIALYDLDVREFRWCGLRLEHSENADLHHCHIENASTDKCGYHGGLIASRWIKNSAIHHCRVISTVTGGGYGYKASGHEKVRLHHNHFELASEFAIESAHENEFGLEIDNNFCNRCISVPKGGQGADPNERGCKYSVHIHHNVLTDSYTVEGPRNHLRLDHNHIAIEKPGGRVYTHHGGINHGPVQIDHNIIENVDRSFVWMNEGLAENIFVYNNTVFCADAGERASRIFDSYEARRLNNWVVKNNIFLAPKSQPRQLLQTARGVGEKITVAGNVCINVTGVPEGNHVDINAGLKLDGAKPWPHFLPGDAKSFVVDRGEDVGLPFSSKSPDIGAFEYGESMPVIGPQGE